MSNKNGNHMPVSEHLVMSINALLANLEGEEHRIHELHENFEYKTDESDRGGNPIYGNPFPEALGLQRAMMRAYNHLFRADIPPTRDNIIMAVRKYLDYRMNNLEEAVDNILSNKTANRDVKSISFGINAEIKAFQVQSVTKQVENLVVGVAPSMLPERLEKAATLLTDLMPNAEDSQPEMTMQDMANFHVAETRKRVKMREGGSGYPDLKFRDFVRGIKDKDGNPRQPALIPYLAWGDTTFVTGYTGTGKTTFGQIWAEHNAFYLGHDVLYIHLETPPVEMMDRAIARNGLIPMDYLENKLDYDNPDEHTPKVVNTIKGMLHPQRTLKDGTVVQCGELVYKYCPGWNVYKINNLIKAMRMRSQANNRGLLVIVDYYDIIDRTGFGDNDAYARGKMMLKLRDNVKRENIKSPLHMIVFGQEKKGTNNKDAQAYGTTMIDQFVQVYLSIQRQDELADADYPVRVNGEDAVDQLGRRRYYHRQGNYDSLLTVQIIKGNKRGRGQMRLRMEAPYFRITDLPEDEVIQTAAAAVAW